MILIDALDDLWDDIPIRLSSLHADWENGDKRHFMWGLNDIAHSLLPLIIHTLELLYYSGNSVPLTAGEGENVGLQVTANEPDPHYDRGRALWPIRTLVRTIAEQCRRLNDLMTELYWAIREVFILLSSPTATTRRIRASLESAVISAWAVHACLEVLLRVIAEEELRTSEPRVREDDDEPRYVRMRRRIE